MFAVGVIDDGSYGQNTAAAHGAGVYLYPGSRFDGMGTNGAGAKNNWEMYGQQWGRWYVPLPYGVVGVRQQCSVAQYQGRLYMMGGYSYNVVLDEHHRMWKQGMFPPAEVPDISGAAGSGNFAYFSWYDEHTQERSPLSKGVEIGAGTPRTWQNLPTRPPDDIYAADDQVTTALMAGADGYIPSGGTGNRLYLLRPGDKMSVDDTGTFVYGQVFHFNPLLVDRHIGTHVTTKPCIVVPVTRATHLELWLALSGDIPRLVMRVAIGTTTVTESSGVADLGEGFLTSFQRFPRGRFNAIYHDRQVMAGDPENPDVVYLSALFYPERYEGLYFRTRNGQPVTGILATRDYCLVFTRSSTYMLQGYTDTDYSFTVVDQSLGSVGHNCNIVIHGNPYVWTEKGPYMFNGQWHPLSPENKWYPVSDLFSQGSEFEAGQQMIATDDPYFNTYIVSSAYVAAKDLNWPYVRSNVDTVHRYYAVLDYTLVQPEAGGTMTTARLSFDSTANDAASLGEMNGVSVGIGTQNKEFMKFLRNRWGMGRLYHIGATWENQTALNDPQNRAFSFLLIGMDDGVRSNVLGQPDYVVGLDNNPSPYFVRMPSRILTGFYYFGDTGAYPMESKSFKRLWFHMRRLRTPGDKDFVQVFSTPDSGYWNQYYNGDQFYLGGAIGDEPVSDIWPGYALIEPSFTHTATAVGGAVPVNASLPIAMQTHGLGDIILPVLPDFLAGRGLWLNIKGFDLQFHGFGGQFMPGADSVLLAQQQEPV